MYYLCMDEMRFDWDENKNESNIKKHGVSFEEAKSVFYDENALLDLEKEFDFSKAVRNPYVKRLKKSITMNVDVEALDYFKSQSSESGIPYQTLINLYLVDCAKNHKKLEMRWT